MNELNDSFLSEDDPDSISEYSLLLSEKTHLDSFEKR